MSPTPQDALISDIARCIAVKAFYTLRPHITQMPMAIVSPFQRQTIQTTQARITMMTMMTTTQSQSQLVQLVDLQVKTVT